MPDPKLFTSALRVFSGFFGNLAAGALGFAFLSHTTYELIMRVTSCIVFLVVAINLERKAYGT